MTGKHARRINPGEVAPLTPNVQTGRRRASAGHHAGGAAVRETVRPEREAGRKLIEQMFAAAGDTVVVRAEWPEGTRFENNEGPHTRQPSVSPDFIKEFAAQKAVPQAAPGALPSISTEAVFLLPAMADELREKTIEVNRGILGLRIGVQLDIVKEKTGRKVPVMTKDPETGSSEPLFTVTYSFGMDKGVAPNSLERDSPAGRTPTRLLGEMQVPQTYAIAYERMYRTTPTLARDLAAGFISAAAPEGEADALWNMGEPLRPPYESFRLSSPDWAVSLVSTRLTTAPDGTQTPMDPLVSTMKLGEA
ncbi:MAG TPA: hypothetical protein VIM53_03280 [Candidatus Saccharimonadales bacterium]